MKMKILVIDRTPNPFGKSRTEPSAKLGFPPKGSAFREEPKGRRGRIVTGYGLSYYLLHTLRVILAVRPASQPGEGGGQADLHPVPHTT